MADAQSSPASINSPTVLTPSLQPTDHAPSIPSPLNPDAATARGRMNKVSAPTREQREKKDSLKKRESAAAAAAKGSAQEPSTGGRGKKVKNESNVPMRYSLQEPKLSDFAPSKNPMFASHEPAPIYTPDGTTELKRIVDHAENKKSYRYHHCVADPLFHHKQYYRRTEVSPFGPRMCFEDSDRNMKFDSTARVVTNDKGWRLSRANVFAKEGSHYFEVKIINGIPEGTPAGLPDAGPQPHVRVGWSRREAPLDAPVGYDGYSYAIVDSRFDTMHRSRPGKFLVPKGATSKSKSKPKKADQAAPEAAETPQEPLRTGEVLGLLITLPPLNLHHKVVAGTYNPAVDLDSSDPDPSLPPPDIIRDRIPVNYKNNNYFEHWEYCPTKAMQTYGDRGPVPKERPHPNHDQVSLRSLPGSSIKVYRNGIYAGTAFEDLLAFLPPASNPTSQHGVRQGLDDGELGYYPTVSVFSGGMAEANFGPDFWYPPEGLGLEKQEDVEMQEADEAVKANDPMRPRAIEEQYKEHIAEDIIWDIIDEATFFALDGGFNYVPEKGGVKGEAMTGSGNLRDE